MKKITLLIMLIFVSICCGFAPQRIIYTEQYNIKTISKALEYYENKQFEEAFLELEKISNLDLTLANFNNNKIKNLLNEYKAILLKKASSLIEEKQYVVAKNLLLSKQKFYKHDTIFNNLLNVCNLEIQNQNLVSCNLKPEFLFINCLLGYTDVSLDENNKHYNELDNNHLTPYEFEKLLLELYYNNYILIDIYYYLNNINNLKLPEGKKPLILLFDNIGNLNIELGLVEKVILDRKGNIATYTSKKSINDRVSYDNEYVTILENFVSAYPEFSLNNAKGVIFVSCNEKILGYKTQITNATSKYEIKKAKQVANKLLTLGWRFGYSVNNNNPLDNLSDLEFSKKLTKWETEIEKIVGKSAICLLPQNTNINSESFKYKLKLLTDSGFKLFFTDATLNYNVAFENYKIVSGKTLREFKENFITLFDPVKIYDYQARKRPLVISTNYFEY